MALYLPDNHSWEINHDDQNDNRHAGDRRAGRRARRCGGEEAQAYQALHRSNRSRQQPDIGTISYGGSDDASARNLRVIRRPDRNRDGSLYRHVLLAFGRRDQCAPDLEQHDALSPVKLRARLHLAEGAVDGASVGP